MKVIICGAGQVGWQIARHLSGERNDVTVVDNNADLVRRAYDDLPAYTHGEIRGQLSVSSDVTDDAGVRTITLDGILNSAQEPMDASDSAASG